MKYDVRSPSEVFLASKGLFLEHLNLKSVIFAEKGLTFV